MIHGKLLGTATVTTDNKITLVRPVVEYMKVKKGDLIAFILKDDMIIIEKA